MCGQYITWRACLTPLCLVVQTKDAVQNKEKLVDETVDHHLQGMAPDFPENVSKNRRAKSLATFLSRYQGLHLVIPVQENYSTAYSKEKKFQCDCKGTRDCLIVHALVFAILGYGQYWDFDKYWGSGKIGILKNWNSEKLGFAKY